MENAQRKGSASVPQIGVRVVQNRAGYLKEGKCFCITDRRESGTEQSRVS
jgi:predicted nucleic acid-binding Zn ribbon protein